MDYKRWQNDIFGKPPHSDPITVELLEETYELPMSEAFDHIDRALLDSTIHALYSKDQIGIGLQLIFSNGCSDLPFCYVHINDEERKIAGIRNLRYLYDNFFERYCEAPVDNIGNNTTDGSIGFLCYMLWDIFVLYPGNATPGMINSGLDVMQHAINSDNDNCIESAIHGLGHWMPDAPRASKILQHWLLEPTTQNMNLIDYALEAKTGCIL